MKLLSIFRKKKVKDFICDRCHRTYPFKKEVTGMKKGIFKYCIPCYLEHAFARNYNPPFYRWKDSFFGLKRWITDARLESTPNPEEFRAILEWRKKEVSCIVHRDTVKDLKTWLLPLVRQLA